MSALTGADCPDLVRRALAGSPHHYSLTQVQLAKRYPVALQYLSSRVNYFLQRFDRFLERLPQHPAVLVG